MASKRKKNSNPKRNAVLTILVTIVVAAVCLYTVLVGLGKNHLGSAKNIELGLDLAGGVSVTYEVNEKNPSQTDMDDTRYKLQLRVQNYSTESEVYQEGSNRITVEIPGATDANEILEELGKPGDLSFQTEDGTVVLTGSNIKRKPAPMMRTVLPIMWFPCPWMMRGQRLLPMPRQRISANRFTFIMTDR